MSSDAKRSPNPAYRIADGPMSTPRRPAPRSSSAPMIATRLPSVTRLSCPKARPPPSTSGPGHSPFKAVARVRIPLGASGAPAAARHPGSGGPPGPAAGSRARYLRKALGLASLAGIVTALLILVGSGADRSSNNAGRGGGAARPRRRRLTNGRDDASAPKEGNPDVVLR